MRDLNYINKNKKKRRNKRLNIENSLVLVILILRWKTLENSIKNGKYLVHLKVSVGQMNTIWNRLKIDMREEKCKNKIKLKESKREKDTLQQLKIWLALWKEEILEYKN